MERPSCILISMVDSRFFSNHGPFTLEQLAALTGAKLQGEGSRMVQDVAPLDRALPEQVSFLDNSKYAGSFAVSRAGACFVREKYISHAPSGMALLVCEDPYYCYALTACAFYPSQQPTAHISSKAFIDPTATIGAEASIEAGAWIGAHAQIGARVSIGANAVIGAGVGVGEDSSIGACSTLSHCLVGKNVIIHRGVHIGQDGFGFASSRAGHLKVPQLGRVLVENDVEIGSGTCIDRGSGPDTVIGEGTKIDNLVQIGHNAQLGKHCIIVSHTGIAGSTKLGDYVVLGGQVGIAGHLQIGTGARIAAQSGVIADVPVGAVMGGSPAIAIKDWHRQTLALAKLIRKN